MIEKPDAEEYFETNPAICCESQAKTMFLEKDRIFAENSNRTHEYGS